MAQNHGSCQKSQKGAKIMAVSTNGIWFCVQHYHQFQMCFQARSLRYFWGL